APQRGDHLLDDVPQAQARDVTAVPAARQPPQLGKPLIEDPLPSGDPARLHPAPLLGNELPAETVVDNRRIDLLEAVELGTLAPARHLDVARHPVPRVRDIDETGKRVRLAVAVRSPEP